MVGENIEIVISNTIKRILEESKNADMPMDIIQTDNIGEVIEKLAILHCRMWYLEDAIAENYTDDKKVAELKRKIDICFKEKRPMYVQAINKMIENAVIHGKTLESDSVKLYNGYKK